MSNIRCSSFQDSSNSRRKDLKRVGTNTQVSDMRIWHVDTSARLLAGGARGLGDLCYARTEVERRAHEMQTFLHELRKLKKCQRTLDTNSLNYDDDMEYKKMYNISWVQKPN